MAGPVRIDRAIGVCVPPVALIAGTLIPASDPARAGIIASFVISGALIGRWWAPLPAMVAWGAVALAEEANHWGFGAGTRIGTAIEIHSGSDFSVPFFALTMAIALVLTSLGAVGRRVASALLRRRLEAAAQ